MSDYNTTRYAAGKVTTQYGKMLQNLEDDMMITIDLKTFEEMTDKIIDMQEAIGELFALLDVTEETDDGSVFHPNKLVSCRAADAEKLESILAKLRRSM